MLSNQDLQHSFTRRYLLDLAVSGANFLLKNAIREEDSHVWFSLSKNGEPCQMQRKPWGACFLVMGLLELSKVMQGICKISIHNMDSQSL